MRYATTERLRPHDQPVKANTRRQTPGAGVRIDLQHQILDTQRARGLVLAAAPGQVPQHPELPERRIAVGLSPGGFVQQRVLDVVADVVEAVVAHVSSLSSGRRRTAE